MISFREIMRDAVALDLLDDARGHQIFNEADMHTRLAQHLARHCARAGLCVRNQPTMPLGLGRGKFDAKPDIVVFGRSGALAALELKCFLECDTLSLSKVAEALASDIDKLRCFKARYPSSKNAFSVALIDVPSADAFVELQRFVTRQLREPWMKHYFFPHLINVYCDETGRKRRWYDEWRRGRDEWKQCFAAA